MFEAGTVTYGFAKTISNPKNKYAISIFRDENLCVLIHFTTTQHRAGVSEGKIHHGINRDDAGNIVSYVFEPTIEIGNAPDGGRFCFPERTIMQFDYGFIQATETNLLQQFDNLEIKCRLDKHEYLDLVYAMYRSKRTPIKYKPYLEAVLESAYNGENHDESTN